MNAVALKDLQDADLATAADANLVVHVTWASQRTPGMRVIDGRGVVLVESGLPCDTFNFISRARLEREMALERAPEAEVRFANVLHTFSILLLVVYPTFSSLFL